MDAFELGDHLVAARVGYTHEGVFIGDGLVIHYTGEPDGSLFAGEIIEKRYAKIATDPVEKFAKKCSVVVRKHALRLSRDLTGARARSRLGESQYNIAFNNCEHYANWCVRGVHRSAQADVLSRAADTVLATARVASRVAATGMDLVASSLGADVTSPGFDALITGSTFGLSSSTFEQKPWGYSRGSGRVCWTGFLGEAAHETLNVQAAWDLAWGLESQSRLPAAALTGESAISVRQALLKMVRISVDVVEHSRGPAEELTARRERLEDAIGPIMMSDGTAPQQVRAALAIAIDLGKWIALS